MSLKGSRWKKPRPSGGSKIFSGTVKRHPEGFGFFIPADSTHSDVYLPRRQMHGVMNNDTVRITLTSRRARRGLFSGKILHIDERFHKYVVGQYQSLSDTEGVLRDDSAQWGNDLQVCLENKQKIKTGTWVQAQIIQWPDHSHALRGKVVAVLGHFSGAGEDNIHVVQKHNIPFVFPKDCLEEVKKYPDAVSSDMFQRRKDLRHQAFVTVDGATAQDFDDAIYVKKQDSQGNWTLYVAIADVSYYVPQKSSLDQAAFTRGNSTYFPDFVIPMLPEKLSNHLCSLKPQVDRLVFVAEISFDPQATQQKVSFYEAVIRSQCRYNYGQAQDIIDQSSVPSDASAATVFFAGQLACQLLRRRLKNHFINLEIPETEVRLNKRG